MRTCATYRENIQLQTVSQTFSSGLTLAQSPAGLVASDVCNTCRCFDRSICQVDVLALLSGVLVGAECLAVKSLVQNRSVALDVVWRSQPVTERI